MISVITTLIFALQVSSDAVDAIKCGSQNYSTSFAYGAENADPGQFPWKVAIFYGGTYRCGGTIIGKEHVLTGKNSTKIAKFSTKI